MLQLDHLVLGASSIAQGQEFMQDLLGVKVPLGGAHRRFGTHNALMQLDAGVYFEIIAIDDKAQPEQRPRWFSLDEESTHNQLQQQPRLLTWVVNTMQLRGHSVLAEQCSPSAEVVMMQRGELTWQMLIPPAGRYADMLLPWAIEWPPNLHPAANMADLGCQLISLEAWHRDPIVYGKVLQAFGAESLINIKNAQKNNDNQQLKATISCKGVEVIFEGLIVP